MSAQAKFGFFVLALVSMALLAGASMLMATPGHAWLATLCFVVAFVLIYIGIYMRRKLLKKAS